MPAISLCVMVFAINHYVQLKKKELLESVEMYYKVFFLKQDASSLLDEE